MDKPELGNRFDQAVKMEEMADIAEKMNGKPCKECSGRGFESWHVGMNQYIPCKCVHKAMVKAIEQKKREQL